jgi:L-ascorbate metabolism protein UlaG (beta-lactamase superfamily)
MSAAHHRPGGFRNPWTTADDRALGGLLRWVRVHRTTPSATNTRPDFPRAVPRPADPRADADELRLTWVGHSTFLIQIGGMNVLTDPIWSERASPLRFVGPRRHVPALPALSDLPPIDVIVVSHNHYDHLDRETVRRVAAAYPQARWLVPLRVGRILAKFGARNVEELDWWEVDRPQGLQVTCTPAQHWSGRGAFDRGRTLWCGWTIRAGERAVWFAGDTALFPEITAIGQRLGPFDAMLLPIGGIEPRWYMRRLHMDPNEAVQAFQIILATQSRRSTMVAMHWGTFRIADEALSVPPSLLRDAWKAARMPDDQLWIPTHGESRTIDATLSTDPGAHLQ